LSICVDKIVSLFYLLQIVFYVVYLTKREVYKMAIIVQCPKGHRLAANESNAGKHGRCPVCKAVVTIPMPNETMLSESTILSILGVGETKRHVKQDVTVSKREGAFSLPGSATVVSDEVKAKTRYCPSCDREIDIGYHICPHCQTYMSVYSDI
jgi:hypothetical protein